jgi:hypothetical protein
MLVGVSTGIQLQDDERESKHSTVFVERQTGSSPARAAPRRQNAVTAAGDAPTTCLLSITLLWADMDLCNCCAGSGRVRLHEGFRRHCAFVIQGHTASRCLPQGWVRSALRLKVPRCCQQRASSCQLHSPVGWLPAGVSRPCWRWVCLAWGWTVRSSRQLGSSRATPCYYCEGSSRATPCYYCEGSSRATPCYYCEANL